MVDRQLPHGYTNSTYENDQGTVFKIYQGAHAAERAALEVGVLRIVAKHLPVPRVVTHDVAGLAVELVRMEGVHGQDLLDTQGSGVMRALGSVAREIHRFRLSDVSLVLPGNGSVLVHGDFGPQNCLFSEDGDHVAAVLDWEFARLGEPLEDLAWAEWIVRTHHPRRAAEVEQMFDTYGRQWEWPDRHAAMLSRCAHFADVTTGGAEKIWQARLAATASWVE